MITAVIGFLHGMRVALERNLLEALIIASFLPWRAFDGAEIKITVIGSKFHPV